MRSILPAVLLFACSNGDSKDTGVRDSGCFVGSEDAEPEMIIIHQTVSGTIAVTMAEGTVPLIEPPQGGRVIFVAARARNLDGCPITVTSALRDPCTNRLVGYEARDVLMKPTGDGWIEPEFPDQLANYGNLAACPVAAATRAINGQRYVLEVRLTDVAGRSVEQHVPVTPVCAEPEQLDECLCLCRAKYVLGECPELTDAGVATSTCP
jgi:hypothetical protein